MIADDAELYRALFLTRPEYGEYSPGETYAPLFAELVTPPALVLDAGCASGKGGLALQARGFDVILLDLTDAGLTQEARALPFLARSVLDPGIDADWVYCCDVLEHLEPEITLLAIDCLRRTARKGVFLSISLVPDGFGVWAGQPLHRTVRPFVWWRDHLRLLGSVREARDLLTTGIYVL